MSETMNDVPVTDELLDRYFEALINAFFKILPIRESEEKSLETYMTSLQAELLGCQSLIKELNNDPGFMELISILQFLIDHPEYSVRGVKREVFKCIDICKRLEARYKKEG